jgi:hypothetical protein
MNRNRLAGLCAGLVLSAAIAGSALAQGGPRFLGGGPLMLLRMPEVQSELKITDEQKTKLMDVGQKAQASIQELREKLQNAAPEERQKVIADFQAEQTKAVNAVLNADQQKRLRQLQLQQEGPIAAARPDVATELKITDEQKTKIQGLMQSMQEQLRQIFQGGAGADARAKVQQLRKETGEKVAALLTDEQKGKWKTMLGAEFKFPQPAQ